MSRPQVKEHNATTDEVIVRDMTDDELLAYQAFQDAMAQAELDSKAQAEAKAALLQRLGITQEEAKLLLS